MTQTLKTVLLLALPASGKSEVRRFLNHLSPHERTHDFHLGPTVQLDDFPYVHLMRRVDDELAARGQARVYFEAPDRSFRDPRDWGTLIALLDEDHADLVAKRVQSPGSAAALLFDRFDAASQAVGAAPRMSAIAAELRAAVADALEPEARALLNEKHAAYPDSLDGKTLVLEFARGGKDGSALPLDAPFGYRYSLAQLSPELLADAGILYVWVTPEESRRKNQARTDPNDPGSILHHGVPEYVMRNDYGTDDIGWLLEHSTRPGTVTVEAHGKTYHLPIARFDNRVDKTSFVREDPSAWLPADRAALHEGLRAALSELAAFQR